MQDKLVKLANMLYYKIFNIKVQFRLCNNYLSIIDGDARLGRRVDLSNGILGYPTPTYGCFSHKELIFFELLREEFNRG